MPDVDEDLPIPEGVVWNSVQLQFKDAAGKNMGSKFFGKWKDRAEEFPPDTGVKSGGQVRRAVARPQASTELAPEDAGKPVASSVYPRRSDDLSDFLPIAKRRKSMFDAYLEVGFTREEALELIVK